MAAARSNPVWRPLLRALASTVGRAAAQRALSTYFAVLIVYSVLLEGNGVRPADVVARALSSRSERWLLYAAWTFVSLPAIHALLTTPSSFFLRALPVARWRLLSVHAGLLLLAELPWAYLWLRGGGLGVGLAAVLAALALGTLLLTRLERLLEKIAAAVLALALHAPAPWPVLLGVSVPAAALGVLGVWLQAPQPSLPRGRAWVGGPPALGLATSYSLELWRQARSQLSRATGFTLLALAAALYAVHSLRPASAAELVALATLRRAGRERRREVDAADLSLREFVGLVRSLKQLAAGPVAEREALGWRERLDLADAWHQRLGTLSLGQRKRACLLVALLGDPWLLILDEPSNGLDPAGVELLRELIERRQAERKATLLASNDLPFVLQLSARRYRLRSGQLAPEV